MFTLGPRAHNLHVSAELQQPVSLARCLRLTQVQSILTTCQAWVQAFNCGRLRKFVPPPTISKNVQQNAPTDVDHCKCFGQMKSAPLIQSYGLLYKVATTAVSGDM